ncbi:MULTISPECIES: putative lipid II flippase FtsW [unclassified Treponema]|uniref:putative lipid II flippase FtsW n=1 Tax=unclassified Treponema TaxID=2638727 RepID=UPI0020A38EEB|nr:MULTISPECIES: putative lipid II flippase FtsW [unclassified Treponema]UTC65887.1 putative lipid II flippase FtsW [Treponema sp. OMZ 789]UTC68615.1 putative lipid II flippase FtsW [Treponema sp. OMZ 790]UTC71345.1 putative lipid II flippase FtsW [Treponema sp. OMZ 791]
MVKHIIAKKNIHSEKYDFVFAMSVLLLFGVGFATLYSGSIYYAQRLFDNHLYFVSKQIKHFIAGIIAMTFFLFVDFSTIRKMLPFIMLITFIFCLLPFIPGIGEERNGASRWVNIAGFMFQPSELLKLSLILFLANFFDKKNNQYDQPLISIITPFVITSLFALLVYLENDFSSSMFILYIGVLMFFIAGVPLLWFFKGCGCFIPIFILMIVTKEYRMERVLSYLDPSRSPLNSGFQIQASLNALTNGGLWGQGLGNGVRKIASVPEIYSDFIFVVWAEEMGFIGVIFYIALLAFFAIFGYRIAFGCKNRFGAYVSFGAVSCILTQSLINCAVVSKLIPATGIPLPFFSSGGSSLVVTFCLCGLILNASGYVNKKEK